MSNIVDGHAFISGTRKDLLKFILTSISTFDGSRVFAELDDISIVIPERFNLQDMRMEDLDETFICFDEHDIVLFDTENPNVYSIYCTFVKLWHVDAKTISTICRKNNVSMEVNVEDPMRYLIQHILIDNSGKILAADDIDYYSEDSGSSLMHSYFTYTFNIKQIEMEFPHSLLNPKLSSARRSFIMNKNNEPCEMCGEPVIYGFSLCDSCDETVNYMRDDGMYILKNRKMVNTLKHVQGVDY